MDWRSAACWPRPFPLTVGLTLITMQLSHIPLHQISIAALIIALGMLVDVPVVASDGINRAPVPGRTASPMPPGSGRLVCVIRWFSAPSLNIVAFLPLLLLPGDKGVFISGLPIVVTISLGAAY